MQRSKTTAMGLPKRSLSFSAQSPAKAVSISRTLSMPAGGFALSKSIIKQRMSLVASSTIAEEPESEAGVDTPPVLRASPSKEGGGPIEKGGAWAHSLSTADEEAVAQGLFPIDSASGFEGDNLQNTEALHVDLEAMMAEWGQGFEWYKELPEAELDEFYAALWASPTEAGSNQILEGREVLSEEEAQKLADGLDPELREFLNNLNHEALFVTDNFPANNHSVPPTHEDVET